MKIEYEIDGKRYPLDDVSDWYDDDCGMAGENLFHLRDAKKGIKSPEGFKAMAMCAGKKHYREHNGWKKIPFDPGPQVLVEELILYIGGKEMGRFAIEVDFIPAFHSYELYDKEKK